MNYVGDVVDKIEIDIQIKCIQLTRGLQAAKSISICRINPSVFLFPDGQFPAYLLSSRRWWRHLGFRILRQ